jgi:hypothetical protein
MRLVILLTFASFVLSDSALAQRVAGPTPEMQALETKLLTRIGPETRAWINSEAARQSSAGAVTETSATRAVRLNPYLTNLPEGDIEAIAFIVLMEAAKSAREDLKSIMAGVKAINNTKASYRESMQSSKTTAASYRQKLDSLDNLSEMESLRLQMAMDRQSKMMSTLSNLLKKISDTAQSITQNLK